MTEKEVTRISEFQRLVLTQETERDGIAHHLMISPVQPWPSSFPSFPSVRNLIAWCWGLQAKLLRNALHRRDHMRDVLVERQTEQLCAFFDVLAFDRGRKGFLLHFLSHAAGGHSVEFFRSDICHRGNKTAE